MPHRVGSDQGFTGVAGYLAEVSPWLSRRRLLKHWWPAPVIVFSLQRVLDEKLFDMALPRKSENSIAVRRRMNLERVNKSNGTSRLARIAHQAMAKTDQNRSTEA